MNADDEESNRNITKNGLLANSYRCEPYLINFNIIGKIFECRFTVCNIKVRKPF